MKLSKTSGGENERIHEAYEQILCRSPDAAELRRASQFLEQYAEAIESESSDEKERLAWQGLCRALVSANEFIYVE